MALARQYAGYVEKDHYTEAEYFEFERTAFGRWEYVNGEIRPLNGECQNGEFRAMSGGTTDHGAISMNVARALGNVLVPRGCRVYGSDVKIHTGDGVNTFPDVSVLCGPHQYYMGKKDVVLNPLLIVEVLSPSTEGYDRAEKFDHYKTIESLQDYLLVEQDEARVMLYSRRNDHWELREVRGLDRSIELPSVGVTLALSDAYVLIEFEAK